MNMRQTINQMIARLHDIRSGDTIHPGDVQAVLDYYVACEITGTRVDPELQRHGDAIVRKFGQQIHDLVIQVVKEQNLEGNVDDHIMSAMQTTFYAFSNAYHNRLSAETISVVRTTLESNWDGIGPWRS